MGYVSLPEGKHIEFSSPTTTRFHLPTGGFVDFLGPGACGSSALAPTGSGR